MLTVKTLAEADALLAAAQAGEKTRIERVPYDAALGRVLAEDVVSREDVPGFVRATVDGYAVRAADTFGCSETLPALLSCAGEVRMGEMPGFALCAGECAAVPTGGALPDGADAMVMLEDTETFAGGMIAVLKPAAPGRHMIFAGDDVKRDETVIPAGRALTVKEIGALCALGVAEVCVRAKPSVAVLSTGDELTPPERAPAPGQVRDVNGPMLCAAARDCGADATFLGVVPDEERALEAALSSAAAAHALVLLSGGSSAGERDAAARTVEKLGALYFHGLAVRPGKPTLAGRIGDTLVIGLPGHPAAAYMIFRLLARPCIDRMTGSLRPVRTERATLSAPVPSNGGREEYVPVRLAEGRAFPIMTKSGLIAPLAKADGYLRVPRDAEGLCAGDAVSVFLW